MEIWASLLAVVQTDQRMNLVLKADGPNNPMSQPLTKPKTTHAPGMWVCKDNPFPYTASPREEEQEAPSGPWIHCLQTIKKPVAFWPAASLHLGQESKGQDKSPQQYALGKTLLVEVKSREGHALLTEGDCHTEAESGPFTHPTALAPWKGTYDSIPWLHNYHLSSRSYKPLATHLVASQEMEK